MFCAAWKTMLFFFAQKTISTAPLLKVSPAFSKAAGSQGRALRRAPQSAEPPFDFPDLPRGKINQNKKNNRVPQDAKSLERPTIRLVFPFLFVLIDSRVGHRESKGEFRHLWRATRFHLDGPGSAPGRARELVPWTPICLVRCRIPSLTATDT